MVEKKNLRIVYMGTPDFAVEALRCLVEGGYNVVGVITMPDKPAGRGHKLQFSPVKQYALEHNLPLLQPEKLKDEAFVEALRAWKADLQIVVAFRMLPEVVWNMPRLGTFNLHASLLPQYRGAAPINWAVINGDTETGITTFFLKHEIDTGEVIQQVRVPIADTDNVGIVHDKLMLLGGRLVVETVDAILAGTVKSIPQEEMAVVGELRPAPKIFKDTCRIDWNQPGEAYLRFCTRPFSLSCRLDGAGPTRWRICCGKNLRDGENRGIPSTGSRNLADRREDLYPRCCRRWLCRHLLPPASGQEETENG